MERSGSLAYKHHQPPTHDKTGMSTFSTAGGLYERAQKRFRVADGKSLFTYAFYARNPASAQAFLAEIHDEAVLATPAPGHYALALLSSLGSLSRHYTLNIDGLAQRAAAAFDGEADVWHPHRNPDGAWLGLGWAGRDPAPGRCHAAPTAWTGDRLAAAPTGAFTKFARGDARLAELGCCRRRRSAGGAAWQHPLARLQGVPRLHTCDCRDAGRAACRAGTGVLLRRAWGAALPRHAVRGCRWCVR